MTITEPDVTFLPRRTMLAVDRGEGVELVARDGRRILDAAGTLLAHGTTTCLVLQI